MAEISISQLPVAGELSSSDLVDVVQSGGNRKTTLKAAANFINEENIIVSNELPPETCDSGSLENYNKGKIYIYKNQSGDKEYILENIEEDQTEVGVWNLEWHLLEGGSTPGEYVTPAQLEAHNTSSTAHEDIRNTINVILRNVNIETFSDIQDIVRQGFAKSIFRVGEQFIINETTGLSATIIDFDYDTPVDSNYTHSMTLQMTDLIYPRIPFSAPQAAWYIDGSAFPDGLESGQYCFGLDNGDSNVTYNFTLIKTVPVGGVVCFNTTSTSYPYSNSTISTYATQNTITTLEKGIAIVPGENGTLLPRIQPTPAVSYVNSYDKVISGSNSWKNSYMRTYLNSSGSNWWSPKTIFDYKLAAIPTGYLSTFSGTDFLSVVGPVYKKTQKNVTEDYGVETTSDTFFLLSRPEVYGGLEKAGEDIPNVAYEYYSPGRSSLNNPGIGPDSNRIKYTNNIALTHGLRTPVAENDYQVRTIGTNGSILQTTGDDAYLRFAPACVIY